MENKTETKKVIQNIPTFHPIIPLHYGFSAFAFISFQITCNFLKK